MVEALRGSYGRGAQRARRQLEVATELGVVGHRDRVRVDPVVQESGRFAVQQRRAAGCGAGRQRCTDQVVAKRKGPVGLDQQSPSGAQFDVVQQLDHRTVQHTGEQIQVDP